MRVAIIGAGPAGMTAALQLVRGGARVDVFEAGPAIGGMSRSLDLWGQRVDLGPHRFFSTDARVNRLWLEVAGDQYAMVDRLTRIHYNRRFFDYPLKPLDAAWNMGFANATACLASYLSQQARPSPRSSQNETFESWVVDRFGRRLFEMFFRSYSEKLWGIPCSELSADFAAQRIRQLSLWETLRSSLLPKSGQQHRTLVDQFPYPLRGTGALYESMAARVVAGGGAVHLQRPVQGLIQQGHCIRGIRLTSGDTVRADRVISTMPLTHLVRGMTEVPAPVRDAVAALTFRNTILVYLHIDSDSLFPDQWLYLHSPNLRSGRVTNFRNWVPTLYGDARTSVLAVEQWCNESDDAWTANAEDLIRQSVAELQSTGLLKDEVVLDGHVVRVPRCYPVYRIGYQTHVETIAEHLKSLKGLTVIGRYGAFKYNNQDHSILMGILAAENLLQDKNHDLWDINSDHESYQERALISESGFEFISDCSQMPYLAEGTGQASLSRAPSHR